MPFPLPAALRDEYPFTPQSFDVGGTALSYLDEGTGPVLLFVHGNPTWSFAWRNLIRNLRSQFRCIAVDHLGMGLSDKPADHPYRIADHISHLAQLVEHLDLRDVTLIGHDWGGCIGMGAAARAPNRYFRFVMLNTAAFRSTRIPLRIAVCRIPLLGALGVRGLNLFSRAALSMAVEHPERMTPTIKQGYLAPYDSWSHRRAVHRFVQEIPLQRSHPSYATLCEVEAGLAKFRDRPWQFIWGARDWCFTTAFLEEWEQRYPGARSLRIEDAGHYVFEDAPERVLAELRTFLSETSG